MDEKVSGKAKCAGLFSILFLAAAVGLGIAGLITNFWIHADTDVQRHRAGLWELCPKAEPEPYPETEPEPTGEPEGNVTTAEPEPKPEPEGIPEPFDGSCNLHAWDSKLEPWFMATVVIATVGVAFSLIAFVFSLGSCCCRGGKAVHAILMVLSLLAGLMLFVTVALYGANANPYSGSYKLVKAGANVYFGFSFFLMVGATFANIIGAICTQLSMQARFG